MNVSLIHPPPKRVKTYISFCDRCACSPMRVILEFSPKGINKAYALNYLLKAMRKSTDDLIAFGDEHNDTEMLELAKTGYAMKNASSVLLPHANEQVEWTNEEDGVARKLQELLL